MNNNDDDYGDHVVNVHAILRGMDMRYFHEQLCISITEI